MQISNFRNLKRFPSKTYHTLESLVADVDVTTTSGILWWKKTKTETHQVFKSESGGHWQWLENGKWTPEFQVERLYDAYEMKEKMTRG